MIKISKVKKIFDQRGIAGLHEVNLSVKRAEVVSVLGPNGSGKTTLLNIMAGMLAPDSGEVHTQGIKLVTLVLPGSDSRVLDFLVSRVNLPLEQEKKIQLARDLADLFEITFQLRQYLFQLSSGQQQKVLLAAELINNPTAILLDEPFGHLDPFTRKDILQALFAFIRQREISVVMVTHDLSEALAFSDRLALMNFGRIEQLGSPAEIVFEPRNLFVAQFLGHLNFIPIRRISNECWETPWGEWHAKQQIAGTEAIMIIPLDGWIIAESPVAAKIVASHITRWGRSLQVIWQERLLQVDLKKSATESLAIGDLLKLRPLWLECLLIPL